MNEREAIEALKVLKSKIDDNINNNWALQTSSYIKDFFGEHSTEYHAITNFHFPDKLVYETIYKYQNRTSEPKRAAHEFIDSCIETIESKGLYKPPKQNFLSGLNNIALITLLFGLMTGIGAITFYFGQFDSKYENIDTQLRLQHITDSLRAASPAQNIPNTNPTQKTDSNQTKN